MSDNPVSDMRQNMDWAILSQMHAIYMKVKMPYIYTTTSFKCHI